MIFYFFLPFDIFKIFCNEDIFFILTKLIKNSLFKSIHLPHCHLFIKYNSFFYYTPHDCFGKWYEQELNAKVEAEVHQCSPYSVTKDQASEQG